MDKKMLEAENAAGGVAAPVLEENAPFSPTRREIIAAFLLYIGAYIYMGGLKSWRLAVFVILFIALTELLNRGKPRSWESWIWLGCTTVITLSLLLERAAVWEDFSLLFLHIFAVWWALSRSGGLLAGESGHLLPFDAMNGFAVFPFRNFFLRIKTVCYTLKGPFRGKKKSKPETVVWTIGALAAAGLLFWLVLRLLADADKGFAELISHWLLNLDFRIDGEVWLKFLFSLPVGAWLFGLLAGSARAEKEKLRLRGQRINDALNRLGKVPNLVWTLLTALFCLLYLLFFVVQARYLFGAFTRSLPEGFIVSEYARQGFFELCKVMAANFVLLWLVTRLSAKPLRENRAETVLCVILLLESMLFAVIAFSKLMLYISCFGFTPRRLQSSWLVCMLFFGCLCAGYSLLCGKKSFRAWMIFGAVSMAFLHLY